MTVIVFTFVLLLGNVLKEILGLLIAGQATLGLVGQALALLVPFVLVFALPMGLLTATLLVFGRLSADQELTAARAGGISLVALATPVFLLSIAASCLSAWINLDLAPRCRTAYKDLFRRVAVERAASLIEPGRFIDEFKGFSVYIGSKHDNQLENVLVYEVAPDHSVKRFLRAESAEILTDTAQVEAVLRLRNVVVYDVVNRQPFSTAQVDAFRLSYREPGKGSGRIQISDMTFLELYQTLRRLETVGPGRVPGAFASGEELRQARSQLEEAHAALATPIRVHLHRQVAFSFACIGFTLVGVPLGVRAHRRETSAGVALALVLVVVYYAFVILAQSLQDQPQYGPHLILWIPNFVFQVAGGVLLWRASRGF